MFISLINDFYYNYYLKMKRLLSILSLSMLQVNCNTNELKLKVTPNAFSLRDSESSQEKAEKYRQEQENMFFGQKHVSPKV